MTRDRRGFALIAALWLLVALGSFGLAAGLRHRARHLAAANTIEEARLMAAAHAGMADTRARLARELTSVAAAGDPWAGEPARPADSVELAGPRAVVTIRDPAARLDLNRAGEGELRRLFVALRLDYGDADRLAQRIMDWRDADDLRRPRGAEREDYARADASATPANGRFSRLAELEDVLGVSREQYLRIIPYLTLTGSGLVNLATASRPVLLALPGMSEQAVALAMKRRVTRQPLRSLTELAEMLPAGPRQLLRDSLPRLEPRVTFETRVLEAVSVATVEGSPVSVRVRGVFARSGRNVFLIWRQAE